MSGWDDIPVHGQAATTPPLSSGGGWDGVPTVQGGTPKAADWQAQVKPVTTFNGHASVQRSDGGVWFGPEQGNTGQQGWFDDKGQRLGDAPGQAPSVGVLGGLGIGLKRFGTNVMQGLSQASMGHMDHAQPGNPIDVMNQKVAEQRAQQQASLDQSGYGAKIAAFTGEQAPAVAAMAATGGEVAPTFMGRVGQNIAPVAIANLLNTPGDEHQRAAAMAGGMVAAVPSQAIGEGLNYAAGKAVNAIQALRGKGAPLPDTTNLNRDLLARVSGEPTDAVKADLLAQQAAGRSVTGKAYQEVQDLAGDKTLPFQNLTEAVQTLQAESKGNPLIGSEVKTMTEKLQAGLTGADMDKTFMGAQRLRSHLGELAADARDANNRALARTYENLRSAVTKDMDEFANQGGSSTLADAYTHANNLFKSEVVPFFENPEIRRQIKAPFPDETVNRLTKAGPDRVGSVVAKMSPEGRAAFQAQISDSAMQEALDVNGDFIPGRFVKAMKDREDAYNLTFKGPDKWRMDGFIKLMEASKLAGDIIPTGKLSHVLDTSVLAQKLFTTKPGQALLLSASGLESTSPMLGKLVSTQLPKFLAVETGRGAAALTSPKATVQNP